MTILALHPNLVGQAYRRHQAEASSPLERLLLVYDAAIQACRREDAAHLSEALALLAGALDPRYELAFPLSRLYEYVDELGHQGRFEDAAALMGELRSAWAASRMGEGVDLPTRVGRD